MKAYRPKPESGSDYQSIRRNGMWYQHWQSGYSDILKKGHPKPEDRDTILAELHSPRTDDFLRGSSGAVPFLISKRALVVLEEADLTGYRLANVEVAKIATKGKKKRRISSGEPEDVILSCRDVKAEVSVPTLHAVYVTGRVRAVPDFASERSPSGNISPFDLRPGSADVPDLFQPELCGKPFSAWSFCSERFRDVVAQAGLTNIIFQAFDEFMTDFRDRDTKKRETQPGVLGDARQRA